MGTREILTLQFGNYSNFVGAHWWNIQETNFSYDPNNPSEINPDILYREGETLKKQTTFTPRLLLVDLKGSLGYLSKHGELYESSKNLDKFEPHWHNVEVKSEEKEEKSAFVKSLDEENVDKENKDQEDEIEFDKETNKWVDFLIPRFHPRTVNIIEEYKHGSTDEPFDVFGLGQDLWNGSYFRDEFSDRIRLYVEECDLMQGFQVLLDSTTGFAGLGTSCIQHLQDEYGKCILSYPIIDSTITTPSPSDLKAALNSALCLDQLSEHSSLYSPLCLGESGWPQPGKAQNFENLIYDQNNKYQSSAILATSIDTISLRYRHRKHTMSTLSDLCSDLNKFGRKAVAMSLNLPFPMKMKQDLIDILDEFEGDIWTSLTPNCRISMDKNMQTLALRGVKESRLKRPLQEARKQMALPAYRCSSVHEMMSLYFAANCFASATYLVTVEEPLKIKAPFPNIFRDNVCSNGDVAEWPVGEDVNEVPVLAGMHSTSGLTQMFQSLHEQISRIKSIKRFNAFSMEQDEYVDVMNNLLDHKEAYEDHYV